MMLLMWDHVGKFNMWCREWSAMHCLLGVEDGAMSVHIRVVASPRVGA
jgi:hypothetical protein